MHHAFVSYSRLDNEFVEAVVEAVERRDHRVWIDRRDIPVSFPWLVDVQDAIAAADVVVEFRSPNQAASEACALESTIASELGKSVLATSVEEGDVEATADSIAAAMKETERGDRARTELLVRARSWDRQGRPRSALPSRRPQRRLAQAADQAPRRMAPVAERFLAAARRRNRRRRGFAVLGVVIALFSFAAINALSENRKETDRRLDKLESEYEGSRAVHTEAELDVYGALHLGAGLVGSGTTKYLALDPLWAALDVRVPDRSHLAGKAELARFPSASASRNASVHAATPIGDLEASAVGPGGAVEVRNAADGSLLRLWAARRPSALAFSPDGRLLAVGEGAEVGVYDTATGTEQDRLRGSLGTVRALRWSADGSRIWAVAGRSRISSWRWRRARLLADEPGMELLAMSPLDERGRLIAVSRDAELLVASPQSGRVQRIATGAKEAAAAAFSGDLVAFSGEGGVHLYDLASRRERSFSPTDCYAAGVAFSPDGSTLHVACLDTAMLSFDTNTLRLLRRVPIKGGALRLASLPSGEVLVGGSQGFIVLVAAEGDEAQLLAETQPGEALYAVAASPDGSRAAIAGLGSGKPYSTYSGRRDGGGDWHWDNLLLRAAHGYRATSAAFSADNELLAVGLQNGKVAVESDGTEIEPGPVWTDLPGVVRGLAFLPGGRLAVATSSGLIGVYDACPSCDAPADLARLARQRLEYARRAGLLGD